MIVVTVYPRFVSKGGAQDIALAVAKGISPNVPPIILFDNPNICDYYKKENVRWIKFKISTIRKLHKQGAIFISHHRKLTTRLMLISYVFFFNRLKVIHVAHNTFNTLKAVTIFPKRIIAVSKTVKENLVNYFKISEERVSVIYNGIIDKYDENKAHPYDPENIKILFIGRIVPVKKQIEFFNISKGKINSNIKISFGGIGEEYDKLKELTKDNPQYHTLGLIDVNIELPKYDYVCLFSEKEGLPLSLIEGCMLAKPLLTNTIPSSLEVNKTGYNGYASDTWDGIIDMINRLSSISNHQYDQLSSNSRKLFISQFQHNVMIAKYRNYLNHV